MPSPFPRASIELDYPLYAVNFDPQDANRLVVGGGGGAGRSGVGNKITVLETVTENELRKASELDLSRDEDSVMSLALGGQKGKSSYLFAGVNSSPQDIAKGTNHHLRAFSIEQPTSRSSDKKSDVKVTELSRSAFFANPDADTYQRLLRVAGSVGAAASGMGKEPQIAIFDAIGPKPNVKGVLELPKDAEDLDIVQKAEGEHLVAFCYKYELHLVKIGKESSDPELIFTMPDDHGERPSFRSIRFLNSDFLLAAANLPGRSGVLIQGFRLPTPGHEKARIAATVRIPRKISATALAVANISPPSSPIAPIGNTQFAIAVAGNDSSISLYTLEHKTLSSIEILSDLYPLYTLTDVHGADNITGVAFSNFIPPKTHTTPQFIKLASASLQKGVAVHSIPLKRLIDKPSAQNSKASPQAARYVIAMRSKAPSHRALIITLSIMVLVMAIIGQSIMEMYGTSKPIIHAHKFLPSWHGSLRTPDHPPAIFSKDQFLSKLAGDVTTTAPGETLVIWETEHPTVADAVDGKEIKLDVHDEEVHGPAKMWEELGEEQKHAWRERLRDAGAWTQNMGESVFKGILFGELAGAVGHALAG